MHKYFINDSLFNKNTFTKGSELTRLKSIYAVGSVIKYDVFYWCMTMPVLQLNNKL